MSDEENPDRPSYDGPPVGKRPPSGWQVEQIHHPQPARKLPPQTPADIDSQEQQAGKFTSAIAGIAIVTLLVILIAASCN